MKILISVSSALDRYLPMFKSLPNYEQEKVYIERTINSFVKTFKKDDKIVWLCKAFKIKIMNEHNMPDDVVEKERKRLKFEGLWLPSFYTRTISELEHYFSLNIPAIHDYTFASKNYITIKNDLGKIETKWKESRKGIVQEYGTKIISFPNGSAWFDLEKEYCEVEGEAMGHCGNQGNPQYGDTVLSYRVPIKNTKDWKPLLTFILRKDGLLSEMKGRGNEKPDKKFQPYIIKLLLDKRVKGVRGGGYLPENNFELADLKLSIAKALLSKKPALGSFFEFVKLYDKTSDTFFEKMITKTMESYSKATRKVGNTVQVLCGSFSESHDFAEFFELKNLAYYTQEDLQYNGEVSYERDIAEDLLGALQQSHKPLFEAIASKYNTTICRELVIEINDDVYDCTIRDCIESALYSGYETGFFGERDKAVDSCLEDNGLEWLTENYSMWCSIDKVCNALIRIRDERDADPNDWLEMENAEDFVDWYKYESYEYAEELIESLELEDMSEPYYGFVGYDKESALERLVEELNVNNIN